MTEKSISWTTEKIKLGDLVAWDKNPVALSERDAEEIGKSLRKFGLAIPLVANAPGENGMHRLIDGHQRALVQQAAGAWGPDTVVDVRIPSRKMTEKECEELSIRLRKNTGDWDFEALANGFDVAELVEWGFQEDELLGVDYKHPKLAETEKQIRLLPMVRCLVSVPVDSALDAKPLLDELAKISGVEILYGANDDKDGEA